MTTRIARTALAVIAALAGVAITAGPASAGSYVVTSCGASNPGAGAWTPVNTFPATFQVANGCASSADNSAPWPQQPPSPGNAYALWAQDILGTTAIDIPNGSRAGWVFSAPAGTTITALTYHGSIQAYNDPNMPAGIYTAEGTALAECKIGTAFGSQTRCDKLSETRTFTGLNTGSLFAGVSCRLVESNVRCGAGAVHHANRVAIYLAKVTLTENDLPAASAGGPLWSGGVVSGTVPVTVAGEDARGIRTAYLGSAAARGQLWSLTCQAVPGSPCPGPPRCDDHSTLPCPQLAPTAVSVDTTRVADGTRTFNLLVTDGAGNTTTVKSPSVLVDNFGPSTPASFTAKPRSGSSVVTLTWGTPASSPAPVSGAMVQVCKAGTCAAPVSAGDGSGDGQVATPGPGAYSLKLWLVDVHGRGGPHNAASTTVTVPATTSGSGSRTKIKAVVRNGRLRVTGTIASGRRATVSWRSMLRGRSVGNGSRKVTVRKHRIAVTFKLGPRARRGTTRVTVKVGSRVAARASATRP